MAVPEEAPGLVFPFKRTRTVNGGLQEAKAALYDNPRECEADGRTFRNLRNSAVWYFENVLGVHPYTQADYLGHSPAVSWNDYRPTMNPEDLKKRMVEASRRQNRDDADPTWLCESNFWNVGARVGVSLWAVTRDLCAVDHRFHQKSPVIDDNRASAYSQRDSNPCYHLERVVT